MSIQDLAWTGLRVEARKTTDYKIEGVVGFVKNAYKFNLLNSCP